ncbi:MAG: hypothetical protein J6Y38_02345 [Bacteroidaceae bacterium]|nr:hypothetical protein [Bacteroidaceae bacterium]
MKKILITMMTLPLMLVGCQNAGKVSEQSSAPADTISEPVDSVLEEESEGDFGGLNAIRFNHFTEDDWNDNEYIRCLRQYITDYNNGKIEDEELDEYKDKVRGKFAVLNIGPCIGGGAFIYIVFLDSPDDIFYSWVYSTVDEEKEAVVGYSVHSIRLTDEKSGLTKDDILEIIKEHPENKVW